MEVSSNLHSLHTQYPETPGPYLVFDCVAGDERYAEAGDDRALDGLGMVELHGWPETDTGLPKRALRGLPCR